MLQFGKFEAGFNALLFTVLIAGASGLSCWECENVKSQEECLEKGKMTQCEENQQTCQIEVRHGGWGEYPLIEKACKQITACGSNHMQDLGSASVYVSDDSQCSKKPPSSVCRCCCNTDGCNHKILYCDTLGGGRCPPISAPLNGEMKCEGAMTPFTICRFTCDRGFSLVGSNVAQCDVFSKWDHPAPTCEPITCHSLRPHRYGTQLCTNGVSLGSICSFTCDDGYTMRGEPTITCLDDLDNDLQGWWSRPQPECIPPQCKEQSLQNGIMTCSNLNYVDSTCSFVCNRAKGYVLYPAANTKNTCHDNGQWNRRAPCCTLPCPPFAKMDFIVVLDSSSSVGKENWILMKAFVRSFLDDFTVREDSSHFAVVRYNKVVDTKTQILLNDYPNSLDKVLEAFDKIPYDGSGTRTGNALNYTASVLLPTGNRPGARDVVLLITDGASQDDVVGPARKLRATGALVFVLPVKPPVGRLDMDEIRAIAGDPANVIEDAAERGFAALDEKFAKRMSKLLCGEPCQ